MAPPPDGRGSRQPKGAKKPGSKPPASRSGRPPASGKGRPVSSGKGRPAPKGKGRPAPRSGSSSKPAPPAPEPELETPKQWGSVARRAAGKLRSNEPGGASAAWREAVDGGSTRSTDGDWVRVDDVRTEARGAVARGSRNQRVLRDDEPPTRRPKRPAPAVAAELERSVGSAQAPKLGQRLAEATKAFERERFVEARKLLKPLAERAPGTAAVRELHGLTLYRLGHWKLAVKELEAFRTLTGSTEQHPVLADCYRALHQYGHVEELWAELRAASPGAELVAEGRIVAA